MLDGPDSPTLCSRIADLLEQSATSQPPAALEDKAPPGAFDGFVGGGGAERRVD
jgi:hypothetical protein